MAESESLVSISDGQKHVVVACQHVVRALRAYDNLNPDLRKLLADLDTHLSGMDSQPVTEDGEKGFLEFHQQFKDSEKKILNWESSESMLWDASPSEAAQFLHAVYVVQKLLESFPEKANLKGRDLVNRATKILQIAMSRLENELCYILDQHRQCVQPNYADLHSRGEDIVYDESFVSLEDESLGEAFRRDSSHREEEHIGDSIHPSVVRHIKTIANAMFSCNQSQEFCQAFIRIRKDALSEYMFAHEIEPFSIEDVVSMEWEDLNSEIKKWTWVLKTVIRGYLAREKRLCEQILGEFSSVYSVCLVEISKASLLSLLNFGEGVAMGSHRPEKFIRLLDMCEVTKDILLDIDDLFSDQTGPSLRIEFHELSKKLGECARTTFLKFKNAIASDESSCPFPAGIVHPLTRYVMNYFMLLPGYSKILNALLNDNETDDSIGNDEPEEYSEDVSSVTFSPMARHLRSFASILETNLYSKANSHQDVALQHIFMLNNIHYMAQKVKGSDLRIFFGDEWIRRHIAMYQRHVTNYERATWSSVLGLLRDDAQGSLREKCKIFSLAFENVYKNQTRWCVPDPGLREDLRISASVKVVQSYRDFLGRNPDRIGDKHIKYSAEDLEKLLLDLFEGSPKLRASRKR